MQTSTARAKDTMLPSVTLESLEDIWEHHEIVPVIFKPTGEVVYTTPSIAQKIGEYNTIQKK